MSISYKAGLAFGYKLTKSELDKVREHWCCTYEYNHIWDDISDNALIYLDFNCTEAIFGFSYYTVEAENARELPLIRVSPEENLTLQQYYSRVIEPVLGKKYPNRYIYLSCS